MGNWCTSVLEIAGPAGDVAALQERIGVAAGEWLEAGDPESLGYRKAAVRLRTLDSPPLEESVAWSNRFPRVCLRLVFDEPFGGVRGHAWICGGEVVERSVERYVLEEELGMAPVASGGEVGERVDDGYSLSVYRRVFPSLASLPDGQLASRIRLLEKELDDWLCLLSLDRHEQTVARECDG